MLEVKGHTSTRFTQKEYNECSFILLPSESAMVINESPDHLYYMLANFKALSKINMMM